MTNDVKVDLIKDGKASGEFAAYILGNGMNSSEEMRPWINPKDGKSYITTFKGGDPKKKENYQTISANTNGTLLRDEWKSLDSAVMKISENRLNGINDLVSRGLTFNLGDGFGTTLLETQKSGDALEATMSMDGITRSKGDRQEFSFEYLPIPIIHVDYEINARVLAVSRKMRNPLDTSMAERAARRVAEKLESMLFTDTTYKYGGGYIYSYLNHPDINTASLGTA